MADGLTKFETVGRLVLGLHSEVGWLLVVHYNIFNAVGVNLSI